MIRAKVCTAGALFLLGIMVISPVSFSQALPVNWEVKYLNLKDNLRALAVDPLDSKIVLIGSDLAVIGTTDGGELWTVGESFRTASFPVAGTVSDEMMHILEIIEADEGAPAAGAEEDSDWPPERGEAPAEDAAQAEDDALALAAETQSSAEVEAKAKEAEAEARSAEQQLTAAQSAAAAWEPDVLTAAEVDALAYDEDDLMVQDDYDKLILWMEERGLEFASDPHEMQDDLKNYLTAHEAQGAAIQQELAVSIEEDASAEKAVSEVEEMQQEIEEVGIPAGEAPAEAEEAAAVDDEAAASPLIEEEEAATEEEDLEAAIAGSQVTGVNYLVFDPAASEKVYLAAFDGVYRSVDAGSAWEKIYSGPNPTQSAAICLAVDPSNPDVILAGTLSGLARSADGGKNWDRPAGRIANMAITRIAVHPFDSRIILAGTADYGIFKSADAGATWSQVFNRAGARANLALAIEFAPSQPEVIYAGTASGVYKSLDGGESWDLATGMGISPTMMVRDLAVSPINPEQVVLAGDRGIFGTADGGGTWRKLAFGTFFDGSKLLVLDPLDPATVWLLTSSRVFKSAAPALVDLSAGEPGTMTACCEITVDGRARHQITVEKIDEETGEVTVTIRSEPQTVTVKVGESAPVDLDGDGQDDLNLTLENLDGGTPLFSLDRIAPAAAEGEEAADELLPPELITCLEDLEPYFRAEPTWVEVQQAASRWAEVHPDKIASWRSGASFRALLPRVYLDYGNQVRRQDDTEQRETYSYSRDYSTTDSHEFETFDEVGTQFQIADYDGGGNDFDVSRRDQEYDRERDRVESRYRLNRRSSLRNQDNFYSRNSTRKQTGISLQWYLADFLYSRDQYNISVEARRLVELRQDVLEQVTLYYFDRRTARIDMILNPPADPFSRVEMLLQIQQLDASLDAMTGGYFTQTIKEREKRCRR